MEMSLHIHVYCTRNNECLKGILTMYFTAFNRMGENKQIIVPLYNVAISIEVKKKKYIYK